MENLANAVPNEAEKLIFYIRKIITEEKYTPTVLSKVSKVSKITMGIGEKKK